MRSDELGRLADKDERYSLKGYQLVSEALSFTVQQLSCGALSADKRYEGKRHPDGDVSRIHVSGHELVEGFRQFVIRQYGALALSVLKDCGIEKTEDIGDIVFLLVEGGVWGRQECDTREEFANGFDFTEAFSPASILEFDNGC